VTLSCTGDDGTGGSGVAAADASFSLSTNVDAGEQTNAAATSSHVVHDVAGNTATAGPFSFKVDRKDPTFSCPGSGDTSWHNANVTLSCTGDDGTGGSGVAAADASFSLATTVLDGNETASALTGSRLVHDVAGNTVTAGPFSFKVDRKAPTIACPSPAPVFVLNQSPANVVGSFTDGGSGPASGSSSAAADTSSVGGKSATLSATDNVGNTSSKVCAYSVGFKFSGFFAPIDKPTTMNVSKAGQAIPLKWRLLDANDQPFTTLTSVSVKVADLNCALGTSTDLLEEYAAGSSGLQNLGDGYYSFAWKTPTSYLNSCKSVGLDLGEGSVRSPLAYVRFTK
jgi:hypothetical protein